jgi:hypothetical protein
MLGVSIRNEVNVQSKATEISFILKDQISRDVIWSVFEKVTQYNSRFKVLDKLAVVVYLVRMTVGFGQDQG